MKVFIVESGEYENRGIEGVFSSVHNAIAGIKDKYGPPYVVQWEPVDLTDNIITLVGNFSEVLGLTTQHVRHFDIDTWEVDEHIKG